MKTSHRTDAWRLLISSAIAHSAVAAPPGEPTSVSAHAGSSQATVSFDAPSSKGGSAVLGYVVKSAPVAPAVTGSGSPLVMTGLTNGLGYTFTVTAFNADGMGAPSAPSALAIPFDRLFTNGFDPAFSPPHNFATQTGPSCVVSGDFDGDGRADLAVANVSSDSLSVLLNTAAPGTGTPAFASQPVLATGNGPVAVIVADINGDGRPDAVATNWGQYTGNTLSIFLNTTAVVGAPTFLTQQTFSTGASPYDIAAGDFNSDGRVDLVVTNQNDNTVSVLLNTTPAGSTTASFAPQQTFSTGSKPQSVAIVDMNGDGKPDIVVANHAQFGTISILRNQTAQGANSASFAAAQALSVAANPVSVKGADINGDGVPDLVFVSYTGYAVSALRNTTAPGASTFTFATEQTFQVGQAPQLISVADIDGDARPDVIATNSVENTVSVLRNTTVNGTNAISFAAQSVYATGGNPIGIAVVDVDVDGDARPDLVSANYGVGSGNSVSVLLNALSWSIP